MLIDRARLVNRRKELGLRQIDLAERIGVNEKTISFIETGKSDSLGKIRLICDVLRLPYDEIVYESTGALGEQSSDYYNAARRRWELYFERIPPRMFAQFCALVEAALKLLE